MHRSRASWSSRLATVVVALVAPAISTIGQSPPAQPGAILLVTNAADSRLAILDAVTLRELGQVPTGEEPHEVSVFDDGCLAFVSNYGTGARPGQTLSIIDIAARKEVRRFDLGPLLRPHGLYVNSGKVYFTAGGSRAVGRVDAELGNVDWVMGTGQDVSHMLVVSRDGRKIYTSNMASNTVTSLTFVDQPPPRLPAEQGSPLIMQISTGRGPEAIDLSPDGGELRVANHNDGMLTIVDTRTDRVKETVLTGQIKFPTFWPLMFPTSFLFLAPDPVAVPLDVEDHAVVQEPVEHGRHLDGVLEDLGPAAEVLVGGYDQRRALVRLAHDPEQKVALDAIDFQVAELVKDNDILFQEPLLQRHILKRRRSDSARACAAEAAVQNTRMSWRQAAGPLPWAQPMAHLTFPAPFALPGKTIFVEAFPHVRADDLPNVAGPETKSRPRRAGLPRL